MVTHIQIQVSVMILKSTGTVVKLFLSPASNYKPHVRHPIGRTMYTLVLFVCLMVLHATFNNISVISWREVLLVEEAWIFRKTHQPAANHWQTFSHKVVNRRANQKWTIQKQWQHRQDTRRRQINKQTKNTHTQKTKKISNMDL
jgi:hypothetical protein